MTTTVHPPAPSDLANAPPDPSGLVWTLSIPGRDGQPDWSWRHYDVVHTGGQRSLATDAALPDFARAILTSSDDAPRIIEEDDVV
ncbi:MAG: hypothetical protein ACJ8AW_12725, partial [Rhodopila sp.]